MKKRNVRNLLIVSLFLVFSTFLTTLGRPDLKLWTDDNINDSKGDVIVLDITKRSWKYSSLHPELDIDTMIHSSQDFTITFYNTISTGDNYSNALTIYETLGGYESYVITFDDEDDGYLWGPEGFWTDTGWDYSYHDAISVGTISGKNIEISIPGEALTIQSSHNWYFLAMYLNYLENKTYTDICPKSIQSEMLKGFSGPSDDGIPGYGLPILMGITATLSLIFIYIYKKQLKSRI